MLFLSKVKSGNMNLKFKNGIMVHIKYDAEIFPSLGIWWNHNAYPDEDGLRRTECALEPIPGTCSNLEKSFKNDVFLNVKSFGTYNWEIIWSIN